MRQQRKTFQVKGRDKNPEKELSDMELGNPPGDRVQSNDCKDDPRSKEENGCIEQEIRSF